MLDIPDTGLMCDLLWSDPDKDMVGWGESERGVSYTFGVDVVNQFLHDNQLVMICRAHQVAQDGYEFFEGYNLVTVFSAPNYGGEFDNNGAVVRMEPQRQEGSDGVDMVCSMEIFTGRKDTATATRKAEGSGKWY